MGAALTKALVVDDEPQICSAVSAGLTSCGFACQESSEPQHAKELLASRQFDVLIADIAMPVVRAARGESDIPELPLMAADAIRSNSPARRASLDSVWALIRAVEAKDPFPREPSEHVTQYALVLATTPGITTEGMESLRVAALLLPGMDGLEAARAMKGDPRIKNVPIWAITAHARTEDRDKALASGCDDYIATPFHRPELVSRLRKCS